MSRIRAKDTQPELIVRRFLHSHGYRFRLHERRLPGTPDIVMRRLHTVVMVNGCFWHGHLMDDGTPCRYFVMPKSRTDFWQAKIGRNQQRDLEERKALTALGWNVVMVWECQLKPSVRSATLEGLLLTLSRIELSLLGCRKPSVRPYEFDADESAAPAMVADDGGE